MAKKTKVWWKLF